MWFAFNFYLWLIDIHLFFSFVIQNYGCDLLSISIFDLLIYTGILWIMRGLRVVICFQFLSLTYWYTLHVKTTPSVLCCDLLSISIFDLLIYTMISSFKDGADVVICFQFLSLTYWYTLQLLYRHHHPLLWFAFNFYLWLIDIHCCRYNSRGVQCCDLLSISIFDLLIYTPNPPVNPLLIVVICFQFLSLTYWYTLWFLGQLNEDVLWFAFNFYLWLIDIHYGIFDELLTVVVICFQFLSLTYWYTLQPL